MGSGSSEVATRVAIVYESATGTTKAAAEQMAEMVRAADHECTLESIGAADPAAVTAAVCLGSWTKGLFIIAQHPAPATMDFIDRLGPLDGKPVAVFTTYKLAIGGTLKKMAAALEAHGAKVTGAYKSRGPVVADGFADWVSSLEPDA